MSPNLKIVLFLIFVIGPVVYLFGMGLMWPTPALLVRIRTAMVRRNLLHQNPWSKAWFFGAAPDYAKMEREAKQMAGWQAL